MIASPRECLMTCFSSADSLSQWQEESQIPLVLFTPKDCFGQRVDCLLELLVALKKLPLIAATLNDLTDSTPHFIDLI